ncbi:MAG TPA: PilZ domain-containing protein [archaeon]|nr:PilZ domain-containing protein [archaeon]
MTAQTADRRQEARLPVPWQFGGPNLRLWRLLDLSSLGARIEHPEPMYEGLLCELDLPTALGQGRLTGRVVWSRPHKRAQTFEGDTRIFYLTGLTFVDVTPEQREALAAALAVLQTGKRLDAPVSRPPDSLQHPGGWHMTPDAPDLKTLAARLEVLADRLTMLEVQVRALMESQTVDAKEYIVRDDRGQIRARLEMEKYAPSLTFYDPAGKERLKIGLRTDSSAFFQVEQREILLG